MILALALASNLQPKHHIAWAKQQLDSLGLCQWADVFQIPCRDGIGADYDNTACLLELSDRQQHALLKKIAITCGLNNAENNDLNQNFIEQFKLYLHHLELQIGRVRPSHAISLDIDLIAWGDDIQHLQYNPKKLPLAQDVIIPLQQLIDLGDDESNRPLSKM
ncbi:MULTISPECIES: 2-amino-4-hydroxy-6-hydroxymethyldihydropteridine pyrophosphokinase [unclassified Acinetobacter]|uniref:2-amino-4-hydroxy-6- hydroxymethyldihydropteridine pyrophosphokinase n=1 Tax=unclassified Acinetobacter TaxID=196816 RepID=UPI0035B76FC1